MTMFVHNNIYIYIFFRIAAAVSRLDAVNNISMQRKEQLLSVQKMVYETEKVEWRTCTVLVVGLPVYYTRLFTLKGFKEHVMLK